MAPAITSDMVKQLRGRTGAGMMDCKKALAEAGGDIEAAIDWLRQKGLAAASKKAGRTAAEGLIGVASKGGVAAMVEVNSETDFVARNDEFQAFVTSVAELALVADDLQSLLAATYPKAGHSVADEVTAKIALIGENISIRRMAKVVSGSDGVAASYVHNAVADGLGKLGVLVALSTAGKADLGKQLAMHIAATSPLAIDEDGLDEAVVARERKLYRDQAMESGKPQAIAEKMVVGRMKKFTNEVVLLQQTFVIDGESKIAEVLGEARVIDFARFQLGEGIAKEEKDFAAEVSAQLGDQSTATGSGG